MKQRLLNILFWSVISAAFIGPGTITSSAAGGPAFRSFRAGRPDLGEIGGKKVSGRGRRHERCAPAQCLSNARAACGPSLRGRLPRASHRRALRSLDFLVRFGSSQNELGHTKGCSKEIRLDFFNRAEDYYNLFIDIISHILACVSLDDEIEKRRVS